MLTGQVKILIVGPKSVGKSTLMNTVADPSASNEALLNSIYIPTAATRIIELSRDKRQVLAWEVCGDPRYKHLWPVLKDGADACIFVSRLGDRKELDEYLRAFPTKNALIISTGLRGEAIGKESSLNFTGAVVGPFTVWDDSLGEFRDMFDKWLMTYVLANN